MGYWETLARAIGWAVIILSLSVVVLAAGATVLIGMLHVWFS